jgi:drug/metabolite transporter (DMT)-like permease
MNKYVLFPFLAFLGYSLFSSLLGRATAIAPTTVVLAIYSTSLACLSWIAILASGNVAKLNTLSWLQIGLIALIGCLLFIADYSYVKSFEIEVRPAIIYGMIACVAVGTMVFFSIFSGTRPNPQEVIGVLICCGGAYAIYTAR